ncbi:MAG: SMP-30/gluconolactonase/LRE family protein [Planctomycetota bacterium]
MSSFRASFVPSRIGLFGVIALAAGLSACGASGDSTTARRLEEVGFSTPESAVHDTVADLYYVSNIDGDPFEKDDNGFISKVSPDGRVLSLRWIDGASEDVSLDAPKGLAIIGDEIWVADIDKLRSFDRATGAPKQSIPIPGANFLNDVCAGPDGSILVSDSGFSPGFTASGADAIWSVTPKADGEPAIATIARGVDLANPNGILRGVRGDLFCVDWTRGEFVLVTESGRREAPVKLPAAQLDGLVRLDDGRWLVSSWAGRCVYSVTTKGEVAELFSELDQPADIGIDNRRKLLLVPLFGSNALVILPIPPLSAK